MSKNKKNIAVLLLIAFFTIGYSQQNLIGQWQAHVPYYKMISIDHGDDRVFSASPYGLMIVDLKDFSKVGFTKVNGLSDIGIKKIKYNSELDLLVIGYSNGNIDIMDMNYKTRNISDIKRKQLTGRKDINDILFVDKYAYLACEFGIVILDLTKNEIKETCLIGSGGEYTAVYSLERVGNILYAATENGIYYVDITSSNIADYNNWKPIENIPGGIGTKYNFVVYANNRLYINKYHKDWGKDTIFYLDNNGMWQPVLFEWGYNTRSLKSYKGKLLMVFYTLVGVFNENNVFERMLYEYNEQKAADMNDAVIDDKLGLYWIADSRYGTVETDGYTYYYLDINGPATGNVHSMAAGHYKLIAVPGGYNDAWNNLWIRDGIFIRDQWFWYNFNSKDFPQLDTLYDLVSVAIDPQNETHFYIGSWFRGLIEFENNQLKTIYNHTNSTLSIPPENINYYWIGIAGLAFDNDNNLWITNSRTTTPINVRKADGTFYAFDIKRFDPYITQKTIGNIIPDDYGNKWVVLPRGNGLLVFTESGTFDNPSDDKARFLNTTPGNGNLPSNYIYSIAKDREGKIIIGTDKGIAIFHNPDKVFEESHFNAEQVLIEQDGHGQYVLESEIVSAIAIDGANRKWFGTRSGGLFLFSPDCTTQLEHFTAENSPLFSNTINSLAIDKETGEVYVATNYGLLTYRGFATEPKEDLSKVFIFPNPVRPEYNGYVAIRGLVEKTEVKITDLSGNLVYKTYSEGGQAVWDLKNTEGNRVNTGVYLVFSSDNKGKQVNVSKILILN